MSKIQKCKNQTQEMSWGPLFSSNHAGHARSCTHLLKGANTCDCCFTSRSPHLYSSPVSRGWWDTDSSWGQWPGKQTQGSLSVLHVHGPEGCLGTLDHLLGVIILGWNHANRQNYLQEFLLSLFHDMVFDKLEHYVFPSLLFWPSSHSSRKAVTNEKIQVGSMFNDR